MCDFMGGFLRQYRSLCATIRETFPVLSTNREVQGDGWGGKRGVLSLFFTIILFLLCYSVLLLVTNLFPTLFGLFICLYNML